MNNKINLRLNNDIYRGNSFVFFYNEMPIVSFKGETIAGALLANEIKICRITNKINESRGFYCGMGTCWECTMIVNDTHSVRTCITLCKPEMKVKTQIGNRID